MYSNFDIIAALSAEETFEDRAEEQADEDKPNYLLIICLQPSGSAHTCSVPWYTSGFQ